MPISYVVDYDKYPTKRLGRTRTLAGAKALIKRKGGLFTIYEVARVGAGAGKLQVSKYRLTLSRTGGKFVVQRIG